MTSHPLERMSNTLRTAEEDHELYPPDSYVGRTYWADLPTKERFKWMINQQYTQDKTEFKELGRLFCSNPLKPFEIYWHDFAVPGLGIFTEGYVLFSIGNLKTLYRAAYPACWETHEVCSKQLTDMTDYLQILGIITGQIGVGFLGDWIGRRWGKIQDCVIMLIGLLLLTVSNGTTLNGWVLMHVLSQFIFGLGLGGEYPMTGAGSTERNEPGSEEDRLHRGRNVVMNFLMQGWGQLANILILILTLYIFNGTEITYPRFAAGVTWRTSFGFIALVVLGMLIHRVLYMKGTDKVFHESQHDLSKVVQTESSEFSLFWYHYWHRMVGTAGTWFCNDFMYFGNKVFQGEFIKVISPLGTSLMNNWLWTLCNVGVAMIGYYLAALTIDWKSYGRKRMQALGFLFQFILYLVSAIFFQTLVTTEYIRLFQFLYFSSTFWTEFGPNCTIFLVAAEVYPTSVRARGHGISAAVGKLGALAPTIIYNYLTNKQHRFWLVCWFGLIGFLLTIFFVPDATGLDLREQERRWRYIRENKGERYHGIAMHPQHLSLYEKYVLQLHMQYDPSKDNVQEKVYGVLPQNPEVEVGGIQAD